MIIYCQNSECQVFADAPVQLAGRRWAALLLSDGPLCLSMSGSSAITGVKCLVVTELGICVFLFF